MMQYGGVRAAVLVLVLGIALPTTTPGESKLKQKQTKLKGLLVRPLDTGGFAGMASQMTATATPLGHEGGRIEVSFNQEVGEMMHSALGEVIKFLYVRHDEIPSGYGVDIAFEEQYGAKDGPSAATACALMLDALITGAKIDPKLAVTGDMNADGSVQPVGGVPAKVRGAHAKHCELVAVPFKNARSLSDLVLTDGVAPITKIQVFTIADFDQAKALADVDKTEKLTKAIAEFALVQGAYARHKDKILSNAKVRAKLGEIIGLAPNHLSARLMLEKATGRAPKVLSLQGSLESIDSSAASLIQAAGAGNAGRGKLDKDDLADAISGLRRIRSKLDRRTWSFADSIQDFGVKVRDFQTAPPRSVPQIRKKISEINIVAERIESAASKIRNDEGMMEELMQ